MFEVFEGEPTFVCDWCHIPITESGFGTWSDADSKIYTLHNAARDKGDQTCLDFFQRAHPECQSDHHLEVLIERTGYTDRTMARDRAFWKGRQGKVSRKRSGSDRDRTKRS